MELRHLRYFKAVAEEEHFGRASKRIRIAQPALTRQIHDLEDELGVTLLERLPRGVRLTPAGVAFLTDTRKLLAEVERMAERARSVQRGEAGTVRIAFCDGASWDGLMPRIFNRFRQDYPKVDLQVSQMISVEQLTAIEEMRIDAGFLYNVPNNAAEFEKIVVGDFDVVLALPAQHRLARRKKLRLADLKREDFVWPRRSRAPVFHDLLVSACSRAGLTPNIVQEVSDEAIALNFVGTGGMVSLVTSATYARCPSSVALRRVSDLSVPMHLEFAWRREDHSPALRAFVRIARELAEGRE